MYIFLIVLIIIASVLLVLAVLAQNPKGGMAANFGASNQVMGVRQTSDFLEKSTWTLAVALVVLSLLASIAMSSQRRRNAGVNDNLIEQVTGAGNEIVMPNTVLPAEATAEPAVETEAAEATAEPAIATEAAEATAE